MGVLSVEMFVKAVGVLFVFKLSVHSGFKCLYTNHIQESLDSNHLNIIW